MNLAGASKLGVERARFRPNPVFGLSDDECVTHDGKELDMRKRDTCNFPTAQAVSTAVAHSHSALLDDLKCIKSKVKNRLEKGWEKTLDFIWKLTDPD